MRESNCFVLFSNFETFSVVIAEAWSCGIPAIYSQCGGLTEINNPSLGIQVQPKDEIALFEAMKEVVEERTMFSKSEILKQAEAYNEEAVLNKFTSIYDSILAN
jgi:glycosyltransferase involved in cell wall biosynthesis